MEENVSKYTNAVGSGKQAITQGQKRKGGRGMREGWEYKKLGEIINVRTGKLDANASSEDGQYPFFTCSREPLRISSYSYDCECVLVAGNGDLNVKYYNGKFDAYQRTYIITLKEGITETSVPYLYKFFTSYIEVLRQRSIGGIIKYIKLGDITNAILPLPPLSMQETIVSELDKINELIRLKKEQLKDYDNLAQSIFYEMFGDPVVNEKGWEVDYLSHLCNVFAGGDKPSDLSEMQSKEFPYPVIANGDGDKGILGYSKMCKIKEDAVTIGARGASIGNCRLVRNGFTPAIRLITLVPQMKLDCNYLYYYVRNMNYRVNGVAQAQLTVPNVQREIIPIPPLPLQQLFAQRIELIEQQKAEIQRTISDLETLLASRMQYWFD